MATTMPSPSEALREAVRRAKAVRDAAVVAGQAVKAGDQAPAQPVSAGG